MKWASRKRSVGGASVDLRANQLRMKSTRITQGLLLVVAALLMSFGNGRAQNIVVPNGRVGDFDHGKYPIYLGNNGFGGTDWTHMGVDLWASCGSSIYPVADGTVVAIDRGSYEGYAVMIKHDGLYSFFGKPTYTIYLHMSQYPSVDVGQQVYSGSTRLGYIGEAGDVCHTHYEIRHFSSWVYNHPRWNNIYGRGDVKSLYPREFQNNWTDPEPYLGGFPSSSHNLSVTISGSGTVTSSPDQLPGGLQPQLLKWNLGNADGESSQRVGVQRLERCVQRDGRLLGDDEPEPFGDRNVHATTAINPAAHGSS